MSTDAPAADGLLAYCRAGFEPELAAELTDRAAAAGIAGYARTQRGDGHVVFLTPGDPADADALNKELPFPSLVFARQKLRLFAQLRGLDPKDRVGPMVEAIAGRGRFGDLFVEHPDTDEHKPLAGLARALGNALRPALRQRGLLSEKEDPRLPRLHACLLDGDHVMLASARFDDSAPWPLGVPRLRAHADAPSRSALKLEEALLVLLHPDERAKWLQPGMSAADLGAAPGGWSWVLARHHIKVAAIDNGPLAETALATGLIDAIRADGFTWQPPKPVEWLVCDMVEGPRKVASRLAMWFAQGWCKRAIFNLKLPMKKRWDETRLCLDLFQHKAGMPLDIRAKQLYHDREEITVYAGPISKS